MEMAGSHAWDMKNYVWDSQRLVATNVAPEETGQHSAPPPAVAPEHAGETAAAAPAPEAAAPPPTVPVVQHHEPGQEPVLGEQAPQAGADGPAPIIMDTLRNTGGLKKKVPLTCQVENCARDLSKGKEYYQRYRICEEHLKMNCLLKEGVPQRFCQQCGRFHLLSEFDGDKRSCRARLALHNNRRRKRASDPAPAPHGSHRTLEDLHRHANKGRRTSFRREGSEGDEEGSGGAGGETGVGDVGLNRHISKVLESLRAIPPSFGGGGGNDERYAMLAGREGGGGGDVTEAALQSLLGTELNLGGVSRGQSLQDVARRMASNSPGAGRLSGFGGEDLAEQRMQALELFTSGRLSLEDAKRLLAGGRGSSFGGDGTSAALAARYGEAAGAGSAASAFGASGGAYQQNLLQAASNFARAAGGEQLYGNGNAAAAQFARGGSQAGQYNSGNADVYGTARLSEALSGLPPAPAPAPGSLSAAVAAAAATPGSAPAPDAAGYAAQAADPMHISGTTSGSTNGAVAAAGDEALPPELQEQLRRISLKLAECTPERLPLELRAEIVSILRVQPSLMEGYVRPGCVHLVLDVVSARGEAEERALLGRVTEAIERWQVGDALVQLPGAAAKVSGGKVATLAGPELAAAAPPNALAAQVALLAGSAAQLTLSGVASSAEVVARFQGRFLDVVVESDAAGVAHTLRLDGLTGSGCLFVEQHSTVSGLTGEACAVLVATSQKAVDEVSQLAPLRAALHGLPCPSAALPARFGGATARAKLSASLDQFLAAAGAVLRFEPVLAMMTAGGVPSQGAEQGMRLDADHPFCGKKYLKYITATAQQVLAACCTMGWTELAARVLPVAAAGCVSFPDLVLAVCEAGQADAPAPAKAATKAAKGMGGAPAPAAGAVAPTLQWLEALPAARKLALTPAAVAGFLAPHERGVAALHVSLGIPTDAATAAELRAAWAPKPLKGSPLCAGEAGPDCDCPKAARKACGGSSGGGVVSRSASLVAPLALLADTDTVLTLMLGCILAWSGKQLNSGGRVALLAIASVLLLLLLLLHTPKCRVQTRTASLCGQAHGRNAESKAGRLRAVGAPCAPPSKPHSARAAPAELPRFSRICIIYAAAAFAVLPAAFGLDSTLASIIPRALRLMLLAQAATATLPALVVAMAGRRFYDRHAARMMLVTCLLHHLAGVCNLEAAWRELHPKLANYRTATLSLLVVRAVVLQGLKAAMASGGIGQWLVQVLETSSSAGVVLHMGLRHGAASTALAGSVLAITPWLVSLEYERVWRAVVCASA